MRKDSNDTIEPEKITKSGRVSRRPKQYEDCGPFQKKGDVTVMHICVGQLLDSDIFSIRLNIHYQAPIDDSCI